MRSCIKKISLFFILLFPLASHAIEVLGYIYRSDSVSHLTSDIIFRQNTSIQNHIKNINIIAPQAYQINQRGIMWGSVDPAILNLSKSHSVKIMPLVTNANFDSKSTTIFLNNEQAQKKAILEMLKVCQTNHLAGLQIDFEHIPLAEKNAFAQFFQNAAKAMHENHFLISVAIFPRISNNIPASERKRSSLENWEGGYDYTALGKASDFVTLMAYDQHGYGTTPGSACEPGWLKNIIIYALKYIPASKISIGVPVHSSYWYTVSNHRGLHVDESDLSYEQADYLLKSYHTPILLDKKTNVPYAIFSENNLNRYLFLQNAETMKTQLALVKQYKLRGVSLWCLGYEDPSIWEVITNERMRK